MLAGGTDLLVQLRTVDSSPRMIVDIKKLAETNRLDVGAKEIYIGAAIPGAVLAASEPLVACMPGLVEAVDLIGSSQIQGRASLGGNLCNASPAGDTIAALVANAGVCVIASTSGSARNAGRDLRRRRRQERAEAGRIPARHQIQATREGHLGCVPAIHSAHGDGYRRRRGRRQRQSRCRAASCTAARVAIAAVAPTVILVPAAADALMGSKLDAAALGRGRPRMHRGRVADLGQARYRGLSPQGCRGVVPRERPNWPPRVRKETPLMSKLQISTQINGEQMEFLCEPQQSMLDVLRDNLRLTGTKEGCATGDCGACSVMLDGRLVCSCLMLAAESAGRQITTIEGIARGEQLHPIQQKFLEHAALQCGICTPGFVVATKALLDENPESDRNGDPLSPGGQPLPLHRLRQDRPRRPGRRARRYEEKHRERSERVQSTLAPASVRPDGVDKVTGRANFGADFTLPGMLYGKMLRSPHAHARIKRIDTTRRAAIEGVYAIATGADFPKVGHEEITGGEGGGDFADLACNVMARDKVLYHGHAVAAVAAVSLRDRRRGARGDQGRLRAC